MFMGSQNELGLIGPNRLPSLLNVPSMTEQGLKDLELLRYTVYVVPVGAPLLKRPV
jgi:tripartite-type tricarboxylate transporter receptor subunit TctC